MTTRSYERCSCARIRVCRSERCTSDWQEEDFEQELRAAGWRWIRTADTRICNDCLDEANRGTDVEPRDDEDRALVNEHIEDAERLIKETE